MADYHPLITRAVMTLDKDTAENRRVLYERARNALVVQLRGTVPPLDESEITRERLALEEAIRRVEVESARRARDMPRPDPMVAKRAAEAARREQAEIAARRAEAEQAARREEAAKLARREEAERAARREEAERVAREDAERIALQADADRAAQHEAADRLRREAVNKAQRDEAERAAKRMAAEMARRPDGESNAPTATQQAPAAAPGPVLSEPHPEPGAMIDDALKEFRDFADSGRSASASPAARPTVAPPAAPSMQPSFSTAVPASIAATPVSTAPAVQPSIDPFKGLESFEPRLAHEEWRSQQAEQVRPLPDHELDEGLSGLASSPPPQQATRYSDDVEEEMRSRPPLRSYRRLAWMAVGLVVILGGAALAYWEGGALSKSTRDMIASLRGPATTAPKEATPSKKINDRIGQPSPSTKSDSAVAQRAMLTTEPDAANPNGKDYIGRAVWKTETISVEGKPAEVAIKLQVEVQDRGFAMTWLIRRVTDPNFPASHTIDIEFNIAPDSPLGRILEIKSMLMKRPGQTEGAPLWGSAQRSTPNYFMVGLSGTETDAQYNLKLLKEQPAFDVALVFSKVGRAFLLIEKGPAGEKVFADAFAAWKQ
ncbi:MAG TPA: hypothetical protein VMH84_08845 [Xanthobacteraceae bacterium]|nr:hypothetical protein [Xanthobacteraceae bacterium]